MKLQKYITETKLYYLSGQTPTNCNSIIFYNTGSSKVIIDGIPLTQLQQIVITGSWCELLVKQYSFEFVQTAESRNELTIIYKKYVD
jgi:hypothetical protein